MIHHHEFAENDLLPPSIEEPKKKKQPVKKPIEETVRTPGDPASNAPWQVLEQNDINFDVDQHFKFRMPQDDNFKGRDVKFNVQLPEDLLGGGKASTPTG